MLIEKLWWTSLILLTFPKQQQTICLRVFLFAFTCIPLVFSWRILKKKLVLLIPQNKQMSMEYTAYGNKLCVISRKKSWWTEIYICLKMLQNLLFVLQEDLITSPTFICLILSPFGFLIIWITWMNLNVIKLRRLKYLKSF